MNEPPAVSVVTSIYNGARYLTDSLGSLLCQEGVDFEVVAVDDGSTDDSGRILDTLAGSDGRLRVFHQANQGLTKALIRGCTEARGRLIGRHDADDLSLPGRLAKQARMLESSPGLSMVSCWSRVIGPGGELLYEIRRPEWMQHGLAYADHSSTGPPGHGTTMFRSRDYARVGGYRAEFYYAQDVDLWLRLAEIGQIAFVPECLYEVRYGAGSISMENAACQSRLHEVAQRCRDARLHGLSESLVLDEARAIRPEQGKRRGAGREADYFVGRCLLDRRDRRAIGYLWRSVRREPFRAKAWMALMAAEFVCR